MNSSYGSCTFPRVNYLSPRSPNESAAAVIKQRHFKSRSFSLHKQPRNPLPASLRRRDPHHNQWGNINKINKGGERSAYVAYVSVTGALRHLTCPSETPFISSLFGIVPTTNQKQTADVYSFVVLTRVLLE